MPGNLPLPGALGSVLGAPLLAPSPSSLFFSLPATMQGARGADEDFSLCKAGLPALSCNLTPPLLPAVWAEQTWATGSGVSLSPSVAGVGGTAVTPRRPLFPLYYVEAI